MKTLSQTSTLLLGAILFARAQAEAHAHLHAHEVRSAADVLPALERDAASLEARDDDSYGSYGGKSDHSGNGGWHGGIYEYKGSGSQDTDDGYGDGGKGQLTSTVIVVETEKATKGISTVSAAREHGTTLMQTMNISAVASTVVVSMGSGQQVITTTVFRSVPAQTVTVTPMPQIITQTQMVTVTAPGTCSTTGLATGAAGAANQSLAMSSASHTTVAAMSVTSAMSVPTSTLTATPTFMGSPSVGSPGQVVRGTGFVNAYGDCDCACFCGAGSFPSYSAMAASPPATVPTTMQTMASSAGAQSVMSAGTLSAGTQSIASLMTPSSVSSVSMAGTTKRMSSSSSTASSNIIFTLNPSPSSTSAMSSPPETSTSSQSSSMSTTVTPAPAAPFSTSSKSITTMATQSAAAGFSLSVNTQSLSSQLVLGNLGAQATPAG